MMANIFFEGLRWTAKAFPVLLLVILVSLVARTGIDAVAFLAAKDVVTANWAIYEPVATVAAMMIGVCACWPLVQRYWLR